MKPKLILIGGEAWTGKSTCAEILFKRLDNSAWLDGDDVWRVNPWSLDDPRLRTSDINMAFVLQTYFRMTLPRRLDAGRASRESIRTRAT